MQYMFLIPLFSIALLVLFYFPLIKQNKGRLGFNLFNSGVATLTVASMLQGILEIAGTASSYIIYLVVLGSIFIVAAIAVWITNRIKQ